ncbi:N-acetyl-alpha-D-glucosaminyl L-malate synthase BshA [Sporosarcina pasteurii]|uniref:Capsular glucan synthase n=1 Tax=Sporosarcina pasteurii TaxID=1474 RepID=A0A380BKY8_SPOPA|nr:N-acetyl-alpha-D-glucosaminyl L-malate synthase BshA [Sporosarcina pasteurii]MDS9470839.1 N-acetyl-alpha-D-glucosaminyl L-malate synthase BshA [Sporosarcina pasteurii]QBQ05494.1 N-acetyl-alpha-D-glucosaminyl L-malate synthase BshA [Sporosarcina pasteurii]SUJ02830.1 Capsular glucan synthase [Sporosarcina pasteurii]
MLEKLKIGVICYPSLGGSGVVATELGLMMAKRGHELHYISSSVPFRLLGRHENVHFHEVTLEGYAVFKYPPYDIALANRIAQVIESEQLDLLHVHYAMPHAVAAALGKDMAESDIGVITTLHGTDVTVLGHDEGLRNTVQYGINKSTIVTAVSNSLKQDTIELINPDKEIRTIYNFIDEETYRPIEPGTLKKELGIQEDEKVLIHISNFRKVKNIPDVVKSFQLILQKVNAKLLLIGEGPEMDSIRALVSELNLENHVLFTGKRNDMAELLAISDMMFHLSEKEAFGLVLLEALACGVPSVATNIDGIPEVITDGVNGFLVNLGDISEAANKAVQLLQDEDLRQRFIENGFQTVEEKFGSAKILEQYEQLYYEVAGKV